MEKFEKVDQYIESLPPDRKQAVSALRTVAKENLPEGFQECISYGMIGYVVPHSKYPAGYHVNPADPLPFINIASQKSHIAVYHSGLYASKVIYDWFLAEYQRHSSRKPDMGKSCIRFKKPDQIPYELLAELFRKITPDDYIGIYESSIKNR